MEWNGGVWKGWEDGGEVRCEMNTKWIGNVRKSVWRSEGRGDDGVNCGKKGMAVVSLVVKGEGLTRRGGCG